MYGHEYTCDRCNHTGTYISVAIGYYRLADGTELLHFTQPAWCNECATLREAERLPEPDRLKQSVKELESAGLSENDLKYTRLTGESPDELLHRRLANLRAKVRWRVGRQSPPRCLHCESVNLLFLAPNIKDTLKSFRHPGCGGTFTQTSWWHASQANFLRLDAEGRHFIDESSSR